MKKEIILIIKMKIFIIITILFFLSVPYFKPVYGQTGIPGTAFGNTYTVYGGNIPTDTINSDWTAGSDNVVWNFGQTRMVYRLIKSLSLKYNPGGEFHIIKSAPLDISGYKYLSFTGRADEEDLDFGITFVNANNQPIGTMLKFSNFGGIPYTNYWTQYNFPISSFLLPSKQINGIRISQLSSEWFATIYLDEIYISDLRGENINPAVPTVTPTPNPTLNKNPLDDIFIPEMNPLIFLVPLAFMAVAIFFH